MRAAGPRLGERVSRHREQVGPPEGPLGETGPWPQQELWAEWLRPGSRVCNWPLGADQAPAGSKRGLCCFLRGGGWFQPLGGEEVKRSKGLNYQGGW